MHVGGNECGEKNKLSIRKKMWRSLAEKLKIKEKSEDVFGAG